MIIVMIVAIILGIIPFIGGVLSLIWTIVFAFIMISGVMTLAQTGDIGKALNISELFKKAKRGKFIIAVIVGAIILGIIQMIILAIFGGAAMLSLLPTLMAGVTPDMAALTALIGGLTIGVVVMMIIGFVLDIFYVSLVAESYK